MPRKLILCNRMAVYLIYLTMTVCFFQIRKCKNKRVCFISLLRFTIHFMRNVTTALSWSQSEITYCVKVVNYSIKHSSINNYILLKPKMYKITHVITHETAIYYLNQVNEVLV